ncbi:DUF6461 domain-containing protein [Kibdelosporangium philippinense]|uniref:DUF6461 domain-containing protein n=1 Tax=Kibdelosporangium philippinense TaxID=211113 RepID=A0ABS8ZTD7_9PSEU|nr:DUF6461 domain-containing protein [Kibdelosporangium philippinense]MCE7010995.1 DUF6461 domain-containing protein [Kibdelosporangium philippinense]
MGIRDFEPLVTAVLPEIAALVPQEPAARLGRWEPKGHPDRGTKVQSALYELGDMLSERLLGALELKVDGLSVDIPGDLVANLERPTGGRFGMVGMMGEETATKRALAVVEQVHPGATDLVVELVEALVDKASVPEATGSEKEVAAQHGASHLALAVVVSTAVFRSLGTAVASETEAIIGAALGAAAIVLPTVPKPAAYTAAVLAKRRAEYLLPSQSSASVAVHDHMFFLTEGSAPSTVDFSGNGLVAAVEDGVAVRTGMAEGRLSLLLRILEGPPEDEDFVAYDEVVEISWTAPEGGAILQREEPTYRHRQRRVETPPWPGDYRIRVQVSGRDEGEESYQLIIWQAPATPDVVLKKTDRLGHRLRGEPEPPVVIAPEAEYRWIKDSLICEAATITVIKGLTVDEVITIFGGDPAAPVPIRSIADSWPQHDYVSVLAVLAVDDYVLAVEDNGFQGANPETAAALSRNGTAASVFWNVNALFRITLAENGKLVYSGEPRIDPDPPNSEDLDFEDYRHKKAKGMTAVARFTGRGFTEADLAAIYAADQAYVLGQPEPRPSRRVLAQPPTALRSPDSLG